MNVENFIKELNSDFFVGVPDSQLKALCDFLILKYGIGNKHHIIAANEGSATALAAGYHLATGKIPVVYMQNSGLGNIVNPVASLLNDKVYAIPAIFVIGWRGEPGVHDEPQHVFQGEITLKLLEDLDIEYFIISEKTMEDELRNSILRFNARAKNGKSSAFVVRKGGLSCNRKPEYSNPYVLKREDAIKTIADACKGCIVVSTTGKISRELYEIRVALNQGHGYDFLTVGSMGHSSSIALSIALNCPNKKIVCIDGDGAAIMHMGAMSVIGNIAPENLIHIILNNEAHESVGGAPTSANTTDFCKVAKATGYKKALYVSTLNELAMALKNSVCSDGLSLIEVKCALGARKDLGRPVTTPIENKEEFMEFLQMSTTRW